MTRFDLLLFVSFYHSIDLLLGQLAQFTIWRDGTFEVVDVSAAALKMQAERKACGDR